LCGGVVRSGAHVCPFTEWKVVEGQRSETARCDGNALFRIGQYGAAAKAYSQALAHAPDDPKIWSNRAATYTMLQEYSNALSDCEAAIKLAPSWAKPYYRKALVYKARQEWAKAADVYEELLRWCATASEQSKSKQRLAFVRARHRAAEIAKALPDSFGEAAVKARWERLRSSGAEQVVFMEEASRRFRLAEAAKADGNHEAGLERWAEARRCYEQGLETLAFCPAEPSAEQARLEAALTLNLALCGIREGHHADAVRHCAEVLSLDPRSVKARLRRASALGGDQDFEAALEDIDIVFALQPGEPSAIALRQRLIDKRQALRRREKAKFAQLFQTQEGG